MSFYLTIEEHLVVKKLMALSAIDNGVQLSTERFDVIL